MLASSRLLSLLLTAGLLTGCTHDTFGPSSATLSLSATTSDPVILVAGDIAGCSSSYKDELTGQLIRNLEATITDLTVIALGDLIYPTASATTWPCYTASWGSFKPKSRAAIGNHDYAADTARSFTAYWGEQAGPAGRFYYSFDLGAWHVVVLNNANTALVSTRPGTPQDRWLAADLAATTKPCLAAFVHNPRWTSNTRDAVPTVVSNFTTYQWNRLYAAQADLMVNASVHAYTRFRPARPDGTPDSVTGLPQYIAGTGGAGQAAADKWVHPLSAYRAAGVQYGVLQLALHSDSYESGFITTTGAELDHQTARCHKAPAPPPPLPADTVPVGSAPTPPDSAPPAPADSTPPSLPPADSTAPPPADTTSPPPPPQPVDTVTPPPPPAVTLTVAGREDATKTYATLDWKAAPGDSVTVYRNAVKVDWTNNDGHYTNSRTIAYAPITYRYQVCARGGSPCSPEVEVRFP